MEDTYSSLSSLRLFAGILRNLADGRETPLRWGRAACEPCVPKGAQQAVVEAHPSQQPRDLFLRHAAAIECMCTGKGVWTQGPHKLFPQKEVIFPNMVVLWGGVILETIGDALRNDFFLRMALFF